MNSSIIYSKVVKVDDALIILSKKNFLITVIIELSFMCMSRVIQFLDGVLYVNIKNGHNISRE